MDCSQGHHVPQEASFCPECGEAVVEHCPQGHKLQPGAKFCHLCGVASEDLDQDDPPEHEALPSFLQAISSRLGNKQTAGLLILSGVVVIACSFLPWAQLSFVGIEDSKYSGNPFSFFAAALALFVIIEALRALNDKTMPRWIWYGAGGAGILFFLIAGTIAATSRSGPRVDEFLCCTDVSPTLPVFVIGVLAILIMLTAGVAMLRESREARIKFRKASDHFSASVQNLRSKENGREGAEG